MLGATTLHDSIILSTLSISGFLKRAHTFDFLLINLWSSSKLANPQQKKKKKNGFRVKFLTSSVPKPQAHSAAVDHHISTKVIKNRRHIVLKEVKISSKLPLATKNEEGKRRYTETYTWECVASVGNEHASLPDSAISNSNALDESSRTHFETPFEFLSIIFTNRCEFDLSENDPLLWFWFLSLHW